MSHAIHKFFIDDIVRMPQGAELLSVGLDPQGRQCVWAKVDQQAPMVSRRIRIYGTGHECNMPTSKFIGTFVEGPFVWHVFDIGELEQPVVTTPASAQGGA